MATTTLTIAPVADLPASTVKLIDSASKAIAGLKPTTARIVAAVKAVEKLAAIGMTVRGLAYYTGISSATAGRLLMAANASRNLADYGDANDAIVGKVYTIACDGGAPMIKRLTESLADVTDGDAAYEVAVGVMEAITAANVQAALDGPKKRAAQPPAPSEIDAPDAPDAPAPAGKNGVPGLMTYSTARLITELSRRVADGTLTAEDIDAFDALAVAVDELAGAMGQSFANAE